MGPKWTCATSASWEVETPTPLILRRPTWPLLPSGLPSPPWLQTSMGIAPPMLHHGSHGVASKLFAPKGRTPWASTPICGMGRPWRLLCVWGLSRGVSFWVESGGLLNPSMREKKRHTRVCKGRAVEGWACTATPQAPVLFNTRALHAPLPWEGERWSVIF